MLFAVPLGFDNARRAAPVVCTAVTVAGLLLFTLDRVLADAVATGVVGFLARLPERLAFSAEAVRAWQLHRLWTGAVCQTDADGLLLGLLGWAALAFSCERHVGSLRFLGLVLLAAPLGRLLSVYWAVDGPDNGLVLLAVAVSGALFQLRPRLRLDAALIVYLVVQIRVRRFRLPAKALLVAIILADMTRIGLRYRDPELLLDRAYLQVVVLSYLVCLLVGFFAAVLLCRRPAVRRDVLHDLAAGEGDLDELERALAQAPAAPVELLDRIADRIVAEGHLRAARRLRTHLAERDPEGRTRRRLERHFEGGSDAGDDQRQGP